jgi:hypothetical protein
MNLSVAQAGPGSQISGDVSIILEALLKVIQNNNEQQGKSYEVKCEATHAESDAIIQSAKDQGDSMYTQGMFRMTGAITSGVTTVGGLASGAVFKQPEINELNEQMEGVNNFSNKLTTVSPKIVELDTKGNTVSSPSSKDAEMFLNGKIEESGQLFSRGKMTEDEFNDKLDTLAGESAADKSKAQERAKDLHEELKVRRDNHQRKLDQTIQSSASMGQMSQGLLGGIGQMNASSSTAAQGEQDAIKMFMQLMVDFAKGIDQATQSNINAATQQQAQVLQNMDASVFQANASRT